MFALSTDKKGQPSTDQEGPSDGGNKSKTSRNSLQEIELESLIDKNGREQQA